MLHRRCSHGARTSHQPRMSEPGTTPHQYLCPGGSRRSQSHPSSAFLQVQEEALQGLRFAKQSSLASQSKPVDSVAELLRQCVSAFAEKSQDRDAWYGFASDGLELPNRRSQRKLFTAHDTVTYRRRSDRVSSEELKRISAAGFCTFIPDTSVPTGPEHEVSLRWLKASPCTENVAPENDITRIGLQRESLKAWPMVCFEGASRGPAHRTVKGWEIIKAGMEHVLGRSIVPATKHTLSDASPSTGKTLQHRRDKLKSRDGLDRRDNLALSSANQGNTCITNSGPPTQPAQGLASAKGGAKASLLSQRNAFAGALAGTCVSLCLHPIDTVKTVIQAQSFGQRSALHTFFTIIADRGFLGLYRGLGSNLASSAPISAIYTFTYESVKAALLPHLPKEYHAIAHCTAGGCASIATSIVYTPSECVKQRMQVGSLYRNSWLAFLGILKNGGLSVLYSGWGAVLCRNVPQSVIKFYTYEGLKHYALGRHPDGIPLSTWQTLAYGGMAGSTAALFTTPFDVIKTRLQTQVPGSIMYHKGVFQAFQHIATSEGLGGLYRGLIPRLVIYVSQGALFFASYEFFKQLLAMEVKKISLRSSHLPDMVGQGNVVESS